LISEAIPSIKLSKVDVTDFQSGQVLESEEGYCGVERKFLVATDQWSPMIGCKLQTRHFGEGRVEILEFVLLCRLVLVRFGLRL
jgi:hypothetical protein